MSENTTIVCPSCGIITASASGTCTGCGSPLSMPEAPVPMASAPKTVKAKQEQRPPWLNTLLILFGLFAVAMVVMEWQNMPSGSVQTAGPATAAPADPHAEATDPGLIDRIAATEAQLKSDPKNAELRLQFANMLHDAKFYPRAVEAYKQYLVLEPGNADARVDMGICYFETGDLARAVKEIEGVIAVQPKHQMAMFNLGIIQLTAQNMPEAKKWFTRCMELDPQTTAGQRARQILQQHQ